MERRLFLAIGLSMMILWLWSAAQPKRDPGLPSTELSQVTEDKELTGSPESAPIPPSSEIPETSKQANNVSEKIYLLESSKLSAETSNVGGSLNSVNIKEYETALPIKGITGLAGYDHLPFSQVQYSDNEIIYSYENKETKVIKSYKVLPDEYIIESSIEIHNKTEMSKLENVLVSSYTVEMSSLDNKNDSNSGGHARDKSLNEYVVNSFEGFHRKAGAHKFSQKERKEELGKVFWSGFRNRYFCAIIKPQYDSSGYVVDPVNEEKLKVGIASKDVSIPANGSVSFNSIIYIGPEETDLLKTYEQGFEKIKKYYRFGLFDAIAKLIDGLMHVLHKFIPNWGLCIILVSVIIYFSMYPLTMKGMRSMKKMQSLQPLIAGLKEKHKDNPQKMNKEMMELYKEHKVNPLGGCLPMLLQMPVFIGLYQVLWRSVSFKGAKFLWIDDLSQPDRLFTFPFKLPVLGSDFNLLPVLMIVIMFFQQKLSAKNMVVSDPSQAAQQKMMTTIMPVFLGFIFYKFASGLTLYFTMFYLFSTFSQWKMSKQKKAV